LRIGIDCDGVLTPFSYSAGKLPRLLYLPIIFIPARRTMVEIVKKWAKAGDEIIIVSARPKELTGLTKLWLLLHKIPFHQVFCVGLGEGVERRKLEVIKQEGIEKYFDDDERIVEFLRENDIGAILVV